MNKNKRNERIGAMIKILADRPNHIYTLNYFSGLFDAAKSTISEDLMIIRDILNQFDMGDIETISGAAGGVRYVFKSQGEHITDFIGELCAKLSDPKRILPGGYLYMADIINMPSIAKKAGEILASQFISSNPDFIITVETKGIPIAMMTGLALDCPVVIARRDNKVTEGSVVTINYVSASSKRIQRMSLSKRAVKEGQRALIIDDFMKGGGTAKGMAELLREFNIDIAGVGVLIATEKPENKMIDNYKSLLVLKDVDEYGKNIEIAPGACR